MFKPFAGTPTDLDKLIKRVTVEMEKMSPDDEKYPVMMTHLERLNKMKGHDRPDPVSRNTMVVVAGNLVAVLLIIAYEQKHVWASKAAGMIRPLG